MKLPNVPTLVWHSVSKNRFQIEKKNLQKYRIILRRGESDGSETDIGTE